MNHELWDHQQSALTNLKLSIGQGVRRIVMMAPTGAGKTMVAASIVKGAQRRGNRMAFVVHSISLIDQTVEAFYAEGIRDIGVIQANHRMTDWSKPVQVCSVQTLKSRGVYPEAKVVVFDEVHVLHEFHRRWLADQAWKSVPFIGLSATPWTKGLGQYFETLLIAATTQELIDKGHLSKFKVFATGHPDLSGVKTVAGDYHEGQLSDAMQQGTLTADIIKTWQKHWGKDKTLLFGVDCAHAQTLQARFNEVGIRCGYQDARTSDSERAEIKRDFHSGRYQVVANVGTLTTGVDWDVRCLILARPTKSEMLYVQILGRALRTAEGKDHARILDHSDTTSRLGMVTDIYHDHLDDGKPKVDTERKPPLPKPCPQCTLLKPPRTRVCPHCGFESQVVSGIIEGDGELVEYMRNGKRAKQAGEKRQFSMQEKTIFYAMMLGYAREHDYKTGWAANKYREQFDMWPRGMDDVTPLAPDAWTRSWIRSRQIAWAKSKRMAEAAK